jgi:hypothetical protein
VKPRRLNELTSAREGAGPCVQVAYNVLAPLLNGSALLSFPCHYTHTPADSSLDENHLEVAWKASAGAVCLALLSGGVMPPPALGHLAGT